jgi:intracellular septation protein
MRPSSKWKPTVLYGLFVLLLVGARLRGSNALAGMMKSQLTLPDAVWNRLSAMWVGFFCLMAILNLLIAYRFDIETWVNFKFFGNRPDGPQCPAVSGLCESPPSARHCCV